MSFGWAVALRTLFLSLAAVFLLSAPSVNAQGIKRVLILADASSNSARTNFILSGFQRANRKAGDPFQYLLLGLDGIDSEDPKAWAVQPGIIEAADAVVVSWLKESVFAREHFPDRPIIDLSTNPSALGRNIAEIGNDYTTRVRRTVELVGKIPDRSDRAWIITGDFPVDSPTVTIVEEALSAANFNAIKHLSSHSVSELAAAVKAIPVEDTLVYLPLSYDEAEQPLDAIDALREVSRDAKAPIVSMWEAFIGNGAVGGYVFLPEKSGELAVEALLDFSENGQFTGTYSASEQVIDKAAFIAFGGDPESIDGLVQWINPDFGVIEKQFWIDLIPYLAGLLLVLGGVLYFYHRERTRSAKLETLTLAYQESEARAQTAKDEVERALDQEHQERLRSEKLEQQATQALVAQKKATELLESLSADGGIVFWRLDLNTHRIEGNQLWMRRWGYQASDTIFYDEFKHRISAEVRERFEAGFEEVKRTGEAWVFNQQGISAHLKGQWHRIKLSPFFDQQKNIVSIDISSVDVTEELELLNSLQKQQQREKHMYAVIGHELRTPAALLKMQLDAERQNRGEIDRELFAASVDQLLGVVDTLRTVARPDEIATQELSVVLLSDLIGVQSSVLQTLANEAGIILKADYESLSSQPLRVMAGPLKQLISNLIKNAIVHSEATLIQLHATSEATDLDHHKIRLIIEDNGVGIPERDVERLFEPYERGAESMTGTGLGLHVCRTISRLMNGDLRYEANPRGGSRFILEWVAEAAANEPATSENSNSSAETIFNNLSILLVEDDPGILQMTAKLLIDKGADLRISKNGRQGLEVMSSCDVDVVLSDIFMPEMNGIEFVSELRKRGYTQPIIALTAATLGQETDNILMAGADAVLNKPVDALALAAIITERLNDADN